MKLKFVKNYKLKSSEKNSLKHIKTSRFKTEILAGNINRDTNKIDKRITFFDESMDILLLIGMDRKIKDVNKATENAIGIVRNKIIGSNFEEHFIDSIRAVNLYNETIHHGKIFSYELFIKNIAGYSTPVLYNANLYKNYKGETLGLFVSGRDITTLKHNEDELIYLKNNLELLIKKRAAELIIANKELVYESEEKADRANELFLANKELDYENMEKDKRAAELIIANLELVFQSDEKEKRASELINANRELVFEKEKVKDLNDELERKISQLEYANKELESLSYSVSHDLKAPVRHITGYVSLLERKYLKLLPEDGRHYLNTISSAANNMGELIDGLLQFSKIGRIEINKRIINMNEIINSFIQPIKEQDIESRIEFNVDLLPLAFGDFEMMKSVWSNLIENAIKFTQNKELAVITIGSEENKDQIIYYIKDNGAGFDIQYATKLFTVFQRLHSSKEYEGTGIGLATVKKMIQRHGGKIWAVAKVDEGAEFYFSLNKRKESD